MTRQTILKAAAGKSLGNISTYMCQQHNVCQIQRKQDKRDIVVILQATIVGIDTEMYINHFVKLVSLAQP